MEQATIETTPDQEWQQQLVATCNRLSTQYHSLLRAASSVSALEEKRLDPRAGGARMTSLSDPPPPPLAADVALSGLQCRAATENICVACSQLTSLIRTLRLSLLLMDEDTQQAEEQWQVEQARQRTQQILEDVCKLEAKLLEIRQNDTNNPISN